MKRRKLGRLLAYVGLLFIVGSLLGIVGGIYASFSSLQFNESAGIGAVGSGIWFAMLSSFAALVGIVLAIVGLILVAKNKSGN